MTSLPCVASISPAASQSSTTLLLPSFCGSPNCLKLSYNRFGLVNKQSFKGSHKVGIKCSYTDPGIRNNPDSSTIDVVAEVKTERIVILGGSGFVGSAICKAAVSKGIEVTSISRYLTSPLEQVRKAFLLRLVGDVFYANWDEVLPGATAVVSTLGGFGSEEQMQRINGEANVVAVNAAKDYGIPKFILISVHDYNLPSFLLSSGYFTGKRKAESEVLSKYPSSGVVFRPGFIYGKRKVDGFEVPLDLIGEPVEKLLNAVENFTKPLNSLPASDLLLAPPVSVDDLASAVVNAIDDDDFFGVFTIEQIKEAARAVKV
ncbi:NAD(P)-binding Rossmann-fold superfamily protein [Striga asiatica]|uniref:NAD(P)-binding Rossmann-fold superfamily protein n=1 Tax=Striga asiatica TaxID=4170 RepID=A0A5A7PPG7_STRAF|nr:NAD(P)-binding Rossmann-fold superfamily protein [Striga asiatica]